MNTSPYRAWEDREQHVSSMLALLKRQRAAPPLYYTGPASVNYKIDVETIKRACETPITVTHIASGDEFKRAMREPTHA